MTTKSEELRAQKLLRDELARLAMLLGECSTILEDAPYERALERLTRQALDAGDDTEIEAALSALKDDRPNAYDQLLSFAEEAAQTIVTDDGVSLLVGVPLLTWSRYRNFCGTIPETHLARVAEAYRRLFTLNTEDVEVHVGNALIAPEHIPDSLCKVRALLTRLAAPVEDPEYPVVDVHDLIDRPAAADFADSRYLLLSVIFRGGARHALAGELVPCAVQRAGKGVRLQALLDSGHTLTDLATGAPVLIAEAAALEELWTPAEARVLTQLGERGAPWCLSHLEEPGGFRLLPYRAVGVEQGMLLCFTADSAAVGGKNLGPTTVALSPTAVSSEGGYAALWSGKEGGTSYAP